MNGKKVSYSTKNDYADILVLKQEFVLWTTKQHQKCFWFATSVCNKPDRCVLSTLEGMILYARKHCMVNTR